MWRFTYVSFLIIAQLLKSGSTDVVIQEGSTYTSFYNGNVNVHCDTFEWLRKDIQVQNCIIDGNNIDYYCNQPPFARKVEATVNVSKKVVTTNLTIVNLYRNSSDSDEGVWRFRCTTPYTHIIATFEIKLYQKPRSLQCTHKFQANGLNVTCSSQGIYPQARIFGQKNDSLRNTSSCQNVLDSTNLYYISTCDFTFPNASLSLGKLQINMTVYPNVTALISDTNFGDSRLLTLYIETPSTSLPNCPEKDILEETAFSCTCERTDVSDIPTNTSWLINGTENSSSSSKISVLNTKASRYKTDYTCSAVNVLGWKSSPLIYRPSVFYASEVLNLLINEKSQNEIAVDNQSTLRILCKAIGKPEPSLYLTKDRFQLVGPTKNNFTLSLNYTVGCMDSGIYICSADNKIGEASKKSSTVLVKCPQQLQDPSTNERVLTAFERQDKSLNISVFGYPKPDMFDLIRDGINKLVVNGSISQAIIKTKYAIAYHGDDQNVIYGTLIFTIFNLSSNDFANYTVIIYNGENGNLTYKLSIENGEFSSLHQIHGEFNWPALGGGLGAAVLVILIAVLSCYIVSKGSKYYTDDSVAILNEDLYWIDVKNAGYVNYGDNVHAKIYDMEYVSPITTACSPPGNYENFFNRK